MQGSYAECEAIKANRLTLPTMDNGSLYQVFNTSLNFWRRRSKFNATQFEVFILTVMPKHLKEVTTLIGAAEGGSGKTTESTGRRTDLSQLMVYPEKHPKFSIRDMVRVSEVESSSKKRMGVFCVQRDNILAPLPLKSLWTDGTGQRAKG